MQPGRLTSDQAEKRSSRTSAGTGRPARRLQGCSGLAEQVLWAGQRGGGLLGMSGRQPHGRFVRQDLKHVLPTYSNVNLFRDCATEQRQTSAEEELRPPGTASSSRSDSARRALKLSVAAGSASLCVAQQHLPSSPLAQKSAGPDNQKRTSLPASLGMKMCGRASRRG